jgi:hypothetical protein
MVCAARCWGSHRSDPQPPGRGGSQPQGAVGAFPHLRQLNVIWPRCSQRDSRLPASDKPTRCSVSSSRQRPLPTELSSRRREAAAPRRNRCLPHAGGTRRAPTDHTQPIAVHVYVLVCGDFRWGEAAPLRQARPRHSDPGPRRATPLPPPGRPHPARPHRSCTAPPVHAHSGPSSRSLRNTLVRREHEPGPLCACTCVNHAVDHRTSCELVWIRAKSTQVRAPKR